MRDPIKAALDVAGQELAVKQRDNMEYRQAAAIAIAAFLDAPPPSAQTIRLYLGEVSPESMRDIYAYYRWLAAAVRRAGGAA